MGGGWVVFAIFIALAIVSAISHVLKNQQQAEPPPRRRGQRQRPQESVRISSDRDQDRFLAEIERLRNKAAKSPKPVPVVKPKAQPKKPRPDFSPRLEELPAAVVVSPPQKTASLSSQVLSAAPTVATVAEIAKIHDVTKPLAAGTTTAGKMVSAGKTIGGSTAASTRFSRDLFAMLKSHDALPMAVVLQEILGKPRSSRR